jgi:hypothetical protein
MGKPTERIFMLSHLVTACESLALSLPEGLKHESLPMLNAGAGSSNATP